MASLSANDALVQTCLLGGAVVETLFYGFYFCLFVATVFLVTRRGLGRVHDSTARISLPSKVFFGAVFVMFFLATFHEILTIYRLVRGFGLMLGPRGSPLAYLQSYTSWDNLAHTVMNAIMIWIADGLAIYRVYMLWGQSRSPYRGLVVVLPILLLLAAMGVNITLMVYYKTPFKPYEELTPVLRANYPLFFAQNVVTTVLIAYALTRQHGNAVGVDTGLSSRVNFLTVARIIIESALLYTTEMFILIILNSVDHPSQYVVRGAIIPTIGIVFLLITIRVHLAQEGSQGKALHSSAPQIFLPEKDLEGRATPDTEKSRD